MPHNRNLNHWRNRCQVNIHLIHLIYLNRESKTKRCIDRRVRRPVRHTIMALLHTSTANKQGGFLARAQAKQRFGLLLGWVVLRYSDEQVKASTAAVARELALSTLGVFVVAAVLASFAMVMMMSGVSRDFESVEAAVRSGNPQQTSPGLRKGPFGRALRRFMDSVRGAEAEIALLRGELEKGARR